LPTRRAEATQVPIWLALWRLARALLHVLLGLLIILLRFPRLTPEQRALRVQVWSRALLACLGVRLQVQGASALPGPLLIVANHISWLDIAALHAARYCRFVSKADVARWPLIGTLAVGVGTLFIQRESRRDAMRVVHHMAESLRAGDVLAVFPEGTTSDGSTLLPFHANLLQAAIAADAAVQPVRLQYLEGRSGRRSAAAAYVGQDTLLASVWRTARARGLTVRIVFGTPERSQGRERRHWAQALRERVLSLQ
jgi:1-acyl-sn-glycerol-3-phosphate acyltransferase